MTPKWVKDLVAQIVLDEGREDVPVIKWRKTRKLKPWESYCYSSGRCCGDTISITTGTTGRKDMKLVLIHELAHWLMGTDEHHSKKFWDKAFELYRKYKVPMRYAISRERYYRKRATEAYRRNVDRHKADLAIKKAIEEGDE